MSENILIGKNRKTEKWEFIIDPGESYNSHVRAYHKIANAIPVNENYTRVLFGRIQNTSTALTLITADEKKQRDELGEASLNQAANVVKDAEERQNILNKQRAETSADRHAEELAKKNKIVAEVRRDAEQIEKTK
jgi:Tfp pilus assembly PilM family ATPase